MTNTDIFEGLKEVLGTVKPHLDTSTVTMESSLVRDLGIDSLSMLMLSLSIEMKYGFQFETREPFQTVGEVVEYIANALG